MRFKIFASVFFSLIVLMAFLPKNDSATRPNVVIIFSDDHALKAIGAYGSPHIQTPNIDRIGKEGALYSNMFCTNSICGPSRATLLTGKYSHQNGHIDNYRKFDAAQDMFPKFMQKAGYQTAWVGKWHLETTPQYFDYFEILPGQGFYYNPDFIQMNGQKVRNEGYVTNLITDKSISWLDNRDKSKPFCMVIGHKAPHREWSPDTTDLYTLDGKTFDIPDTFEDTYNNRTAAQKQDMTIDKTMTIRSDLKVDNEEMTYGKRMNDAQRKAWEAYYKPRNEDFKRKNLTGKDLVKWKYQRYMHDYLSCILSVDRNVGRILKYLDDNGLAENTIVMYSSDQGFYLGEHGWFDKRWMYEESLHMPLLVRYPKKIKAGTVNKNMFMNVDFATTVLEEAKAEVPKEMQGRSFLSNPKGYKSTYYHYYEYPKDHNVSPHFGVRTDRYKLIRFYKADDYYELYDLKADPKELNNLYGKAGYENITQKLKTELKTLTKKYKDTEAEGILNSDK